MNWDHLKIFLAIAETGALSLAASQLKVNHSTIFRRLKAFEDELGGRLFDKIDNRYHLTILGERLLAHAKAIESHSQSIEREVMGQDFAPSGLVRITAPFNLANRYLPKLLTPFRQAYPAIQFEFLSSNQQVNMDSRLADIALRVSSSPPDHLVGRKLAEIPWGIFIGKDYASGFPTDFPLDHLSQFDLIGGSGLMQTLPAFQWLAQSHPNRITTYCDELTAMSYFAEEGQGLAFLPMDQQRPGLVYLRDFPPAGYSKLWLLTHPDLRKTARIRLVMDAIGAQINDQLFHPT